MPVSPDARPAPRASRAPEPRPDRDPPRAADPDPDPLRFYRAPRPDGRRGATVTWRFDDWAQL
jgi:hypothetical protein